MNDAAVIDEEKWLLAAIESRQDSSRSIAACPPTFLQAMGEREYDNPLSSMETISYAAVEALSKLVGSKEWKESVD